MPAKLYHLHILLLLLAVPALNSKAQVSDLSGYKIFVNPGHGGYDSNDRFIEATGFWESEGNLVKGLFLREILQNLNATVFMSRITNTTADDLPLSTISEMANAANVDFFLSIHSNGFDGTQNRPLMLFRGYDNDPVFPASKEMAQIMWQKVFENGNCWTNNNPYVKGDWTFYPSWGTQGLGVLRNLTMPGVLSEGSFHDYIPESWRLRNTDFLHHESWALARSFMQYYNADPSGFGIIAGIIRDPLRSPPWYFKAGTKDSALPLNGAQVTLTPGNKTYQADNLNNGFFLFDSLAPGNYKVHVSGIPDFMNDSIDLTVAANISTLAEVYPDFDTTMVPQVISVTPSFADSLALYQEITFSFSMTMNRDSVIKYLQFDPPADLNYSWNSANTILKITPQIKYDPETNYSITLLTGACSKWKVGLDREYNYEFVTVNRTRLKIEKVFPSDGQTGISLFPQIWLRFDAPLNGATVPSSITFSDQSGSQPLRMRETYFSSDGKGYFRFELSDPLALNENYTLLLKGTLADISGTTLGSDTEISFVTREQGYPVGTPLESFDDISKFWDPETSGSTVGTNNPLTTFTSSSTIIKGGTASGKLTYVFVNPDGGVCRVFNTEKPQFSYDATKFVGVWVYGDLSYNLLEYWFYSSGTTNQIVMVDTINWAGWEFKTIPQTLIGGTGDRNFHSVVIRQTPVGNKSGAIWFDEAIIHGDIDDENPEEPEEYDLLVYPNPARYQATIVADITERSKVTIRIYNSSGRLTGNFADSILEPGRHPFDWTPLPSASSGIYFIRMEIRSPDNRLIRVITRKAVFLR
ncbi:MAG: Ig-like domain-containing protein [Bacteroidales bacterium]